MVLIFDSHSRRFRRDHTEDVLIRNVAQTVVRTPTLTHTRVLEQRCFFHSSLNLTQPPRGLLLWSGYVLWCTINRLKMFARSKQASVSLAGQQIIFRWANGLMLIGWLHHANFYRWRQSFFLYVRRRRCLCLHMQSWRNWCCTEGSGFKPPQPSEGKRWNEGKDDALEHLGVEERINRLFEIIIRFSGSFQTCPLPTWSSVLLTVCYLLPPLTSLCLSYYSHMIKPKSKSISFKPSS